MSEDYGWEIYERKWYDWPLKKMGEFLIKELKLYGNPIAFAWFPTSGSMPPHLDEYIYKGNLHLTHCQFMQRARFRDEIYILDSEARAGMPGTCAGDSYVGLMSREEYLDGRLMMGLSHTRTDPSLGVKARLGIFGSPVASRRAEYRDYHIVPPPVRYLAIAPLNNCPFDPDVITMVGNPRQLTMAARALMYFTGKSIHGNCGPATCSESWAAAYITGEPHFIIGSHGAFGSVGLDPCEFTLSVPSEQGRTLCEVLELWHERGKLMFQESPPNEEREFIKAPHDGEYSSGDYRKPDYKPWNKRLTTPYKNWMERRREKGLYVPE